MKWKKITTIVLSLGVVCVKLHAQGFGGCTDSPEDPTVVLGILGFASMSTMILRSRMQARKRDK